MSQPGIHATLDALYAAALEPGEWPRALAALAGEVNAVGTVILPFDLARAAETIASQGLAEANEAYKSHWFQFDTRIQKAKEIRLAPGVVVDSDYISPDIIRKDMFYQDFLRPHGLGSCMSYIADDPDEGLVTISTQRALKAHHYESADIACFEILAPHIARAFTLSCRFAQVRALASDFSEALQHLTAGVIVLDGSGRVRFVSEPARQLLGDGLQAARGEVPRAAMAADRARLERLIGAAIDGREAEAGAMLVQRPRRGRPLHVEVIGLRSETVSAHVTGSAGRSVLLLLRDLHRTALNRSANTLLDLGLTPAEARIAAQIGAGRSPLEAAKANAVSEGTVRTQLKAVYGKLGLSKQSELAILVTRINDVS